MLDPKDCEGVFSKLWYVKLSDWERGLICAIIGIPIGIVYDWATSATLAISWQAVLKGAVVGGLAYVGKNFGTGSNGRLFTNSK
jgi:hypothetical protein